MLNLPTPPLPPPSTRRVSPGSRTGKGAFLRSSSPPRRSLRHFVMDSPKQGASVQNELSAIYGQTQRLSRTVWIRRALKWCSALPVAALIHLPLSVFHHLISHVRLSVSFADREWTAEGCGFFVDFFKALQQLQSLHGVASVPTLAAASQLKQVTLHLIMGFSLVLAY